MNEELVSLLHALDGVRQSPKYHPEGDVWVHTLFVCDAAAAIAILKHHTDEQLVRSAKILRQLSSNLLELTAQSPDFGEAHESMAIGYSGPLVPARWEGP